MGSITIFENFAVVVVVVGGVGVDVGGVGGGGGDGGGWFWLCWGLVVVVDGWMGSITIF